MKRNGTLVIGVYSHPEYLPPTLNAIDQLSGTYEHIYVIHRNVFGFDWEYPSNVTLLYSGKQLHAKEAEKKPLINKLIAFFTFSFLLARTFNRKKANTLLLYDYIPVLSYRIMRFLMKKPGLLWYHNHDVAEIQNIRKWTLAWWAWKAETWIFPRLNIFSLPALERQECFPMKSFKGKFFFLPNFPSKKVYNRFTASKMPGSVLRILYQGSIAPQHGLEEIISLLSQPIAGKEINLVLKGFISQEYLHQLEQLAEQHNVRSKLIYTGASGYKGVIENALTCHIGIGIHQKKDIMNQTLGTASNKIYEYIACGMPVLLYDNPHFRKHLEHFEWAIFTDCSEESLTFCLNKIISNYTYYSECARKDFVDSLNFEKFFLPLVEG
jgi:glycosyltransferase involved in cell wall biosynthesis